MVSWLLLSIFAALIIREAYQGSSVSILNALITDQSDRPLSDYLSAFTKLTRVIFLSILSLSGALYLLANSIKHQADRRSVTHLNMVLFALLFAVIVLRDPALFTEPRFWAEEATIYFRTAYIAPAWNALIAPHQGYFSLWANLAGVLATIPPIEYAPAVTTGMALLVLLLTLVAILINESATLDSTLKKTVAGIAALVVAATGEIWLTTINSQHYLPLLVFLILIDSKRDPLKRRIGFGVTAIAGLSSVAANFLTPLFLLRYWQRRDRADLILFFILASTSIIQFLAIAYWFSNPEPAGPTRFPSNFHPFFILLRIIYYAFAYPLFGGAWLLAWSGAAVLLVIGYQARILMRDHWVFPGAILSLTSLSIISSIDMQGGPRYAYSAAVILILQLLTYSCDLRLPKATKKTAAVLLSLSMVYWSLHYKSGMTPFRDPNWPAWSDEVKAWRLDPDRKLQAHPIWEGQTAKNIVWSVKLPTKEGKAGMENTLKFKPEDIREHYQR
jgi:hypothetical protein